jgi:hypothetical protein
LKGPSTLQCPLAAPRSVHLIPSSIVGTSTYTKNVCLPGIILPFHRVFTSLGISREDRHSAKFRLSGKVMPSHQFHGRTPPHLLCEAPALLVFFGFARVVAAPSFHQLVEPAVPLLSTAFGGLLGLPLPPRSRSLRRSVMVHSIVATEPAPPRGPRGLALARSCCSSQQLPQAVRSDQCRTKEQCCPEPRSPSLLELDAEGRH